MLCPMRDSTTAKSAAVWPATVPAVSGPRQARHSERKIIASIPPTGHRRPRDEGSGSGGNVGTQEALRGGRGERGQAESPVGPTAGKRGQACGERGHFFHAGGEAGE